MSIARIGKVAKIAQQTIDPGSGVNLTGLKGIVRLYYDADEEDPESRDMALIEWTPETLDALPKKHFAAALEEDLNWSSAVVGLDILEETDDVMSEYALAWKKQEIFTRYILDGLGREGKMIAKVFETPVDPEKKTPDDCWFDYLSPYLTKPLRVSACYPYEEGDGPINEGDRCFLTGLNGIDPTLGILAEVEKDGQPLVVPLQDLAGEESSKNGRFINAYGLWKAYSA